MVFEAISHISQILHHPVSSAQNVTIHHHQSLNLVGGYDQTYNSLPGGHFDHDNVSAWSQDYSMRPIDSTGLQAEGGAFGPFACDNDGFSCFIYNTGAFDDFASNSGSLAQAGEAIGDSDTYRVYTTYGTGAESLHRRAPVDGPPPPSTAPSGLGEGRSSCPLAVDCDGDPHFHIH